MMDSETFELKLGTVAAEAVQQTLDALGVQVQQVNAAASGPATGDRPPQTAASVSTSTPGAAALPADAATADTEPPAPIDLAPLLVALDRQTEILERIATILETQPVQPPSTY
jgi:hypothetical protein